MNALSQHARRAFVGPVDAVEALRWKPKIARNREICVGGGADTLESSKIIPWRASIPSG